MTLVQGYKDIVRSFPYLPLVQGYKDIVRSFPYLPFKVVYKKGIDIPVADALSHVTPMDPEDNIKLPIIAVNMITTQF